MKKLIITGMAAMIAAVAMAGNGVNPQFLKWQKMKAAGMLPHQRKAAEQATPAPAPTPAPKKMKLMAAAPAKTAPLQAAPDEDVVSSLVPDVVSLDYLRDVNANGVRKPVDGFPVRFDLRDEGRVTVAKSQGIWNTCWAFAACGALESAYLGVEATQHDFSEKHMVENHGYDTSIADGGNSRMAMAYLLGWKGPVNEADAPYPTGDKWTAGTPSGLSAVKRVQQVRFLRARAKPLDNDEIKDAIMNFGAVDATIYWNSLFYSSISSSYNCNLINHSCNHAVTIIGWDDDYAPTHFSTPTLGKGAFIVRNSKGAGWGDEGCFYVSYYDATLGTEGMIAFNDIAANTGYQTIYQYDELGWVSVHDGGNASSSTAWGANIFTASEDDKIAAVGFYALVPNTSYKIHVYKNCATSTSNSDLPITGTLATSQSGETKYAGYLTVPLNEKVDLKKGDRFSIVIKITTPSFKTPLAIEQPVAGKSSRASSNPGESFYSSNGSRWRDFSEARSRYVGSSFCCKAYGYGDKEGPDGEIVAIDVEGPTTIASGKSGTFKVTQIFDKGERWPSSDFDVQIVSGGSAVDGEITYSEDYQQAFVAVRSGLTEDTVVRLNFYDFSSGIEKDVEFTATKMPPPAPTGLTASCGETESAVRLTWEPVEGAGSYAVYRASGANASSANATFLREIDAPMFSDTEATPGVDYTYFIKSKNASGTGAFSAGVLGWRKLAAPPDLGATDGDAEYVQLTWSAVEGANFYQVYRAEDMDEEGAPVDPVVVSDGWVEACSCRDVPPVKGKRYFYYVKAALSFTGLRASSYSVFDEGSSKAPVTLTAIKIEGPDNVAAGSVNGYTVTAFLSTGDRLEKVEDVRWTLSLGGEPVVASLFDFEALVNGGLVANATLVRLSAEWRYEGEDGPIVRNDTLVVTVAPVKPVQPKAVKVVSTSAEEGTALQWEAVDGASSYRLYCGDAAESATLVGEVIGTDFTDVRSIPQATCRYFLVAVNAAGESPMSEASDLVRRNLPASTYVQATEDETKQVTVRWLRVDNAKFYRVYRAASRDEEPKPISGWIAGLSFVDTDVTPGDTHFYCVKAALDEEGLSESAFSLKTIGKPRPENTLVAIEISGPASIQYDSSGSFVCKATYANGVCRDVHPTWSFKSANPLVSVSSSGIVSAGHVTGDDLHLELQASFTDDGVTKTDSQAVTVVAWKEQVAKLFVSNVVVRARWPWNGIVGISYDLYALPSTARAVVTVCGHDHDLNRDLQAVTLTGDGVEYPAAGGAPHKDCLVTWNLGADYTNFHASAFSVTLEAAPFKVAPPAGFGASDATSTNGVELAWEEAFGGISYEIWRSLDADFGNAELIKSVEGATAYTDDQAEPGETYYYWIKTVSGEWESDVSPAAGPVVGRRAVPPPVIPTINLQDGLAAYYPFDGKADDMSGNGNDLVRIAGNEPTAVEGHDGKPEGASRIENGTVYGTGTNVAQCVTLKDSFTFSAWFRTEKTAQLPKEQVRGFNTGCDFLIQPSVPSDAGAVGYGVSVDANGICLFERDGGSLPCVLRYAADLEGWHHLAFTVAENGAPSLYVDGTFAKTGIGTDKLKELFVTLGLFGGEFGSFAGDVDDVCYYDRALEADEIAALFESGSPLMDDKPIADKPEVSVAYGADGATVTVADVAEGTAYYSIVRKDGGDAVESREYTIPFTVDGDATVVVWVEREGYYNSPRVRLEVKPDWKSRASETLSNNDGAISYDTFGDCDWVFDPGVSSDENPGSMRSGKIVGNGITAMSAKVSGKGLFAFDCKVSSEDGFDFLVVTVDGETAHKISGEVDWHEVVLVFTNEAVHTVTWAYTKDATIDRGHDCAWVDYVSWAVEGSYVGAPVGTVTPLAGGASNEVALACANLPNAKIEYRVEGFASGEGEWTVYEGPFVVEGEAVVYARAKCEGYEDSSVSKTVVRRPWIVRANEALLMDEVSRANVALYGDYFEYGTDEEFWWDQDRTVVSDGTWASMKSPMLRDATSEEMPMGIGASMYGKVTGAGTLYFDRKVDSEAGWDVLTYYAGEEDEFDYAYADAISGDRDWERVKLVFHVNGPHVIEWEYNKDDTGKAGRDAAWIDYVKWVPARYVPAAPEAKTGYIFGGYGDGTSEGAKYTAGEMLDAEDANETFIPVWSPIHYELVIAAKPASEDGQTKWNLAYDEQMTLPLSDGFDFKVGYVCIGWSKTEGGEIDFADTGLTVENLTAEDGAVVTLYPVLKPVEYVIRLYDGVSETPQEIATKYDQDVVLPAPAEREGYDFLGWANSVSGTVVHVAGDTVRNLVAKQVGDMPGEIAFYAQWKLARPTDPVVIALDIDDPNAQVTTGGDAGWFSQSDTVVSGDTALQSGKIHANQSSILETTLVYPVRKRISFWWKVSCEEKWDTFTFYINEVEKKQISGLDGDWQEYTTVIAAGTNTLKWVYAKDDTGDRGQDCGWLDKFTVSDITDEEAKEIQEREEEEAEAERQRREEQEREESLFKVIQYTISKRPYTVDDALAATNTPSIWMDDPVTGTYPYINFGDNVTVVTHFPSSRVSFPGNAQGGRKATYYACQVTGRIYVPEAGKWTFACGSDDGFRCTLSGNGWNDSFEYYKDRSYGTTLKTFDFPKAGVYNLYLIYFEYGDNSILDLSCAKGTYRSFTNGKFKLVGTEESGITLVGKSTPDDPVKPVEKRSLYVSEWKGNDATGDGSEEKPYRTLAKGIGVANDGDTVLVQPGTYAENVKIEGKAVKLVAVAQPGTNTVIRGDGTCSTVTIAEDAAGSVVDGFVITGGFGNRYNGGWNVYGGGVDSLASCEIRNCLILNNGNSSTYFGGGFHATNKGNNTLVYNCIFEGNAACFCGGATLIEGEAVVTLERCTVIKNKISYKCGGIGIANSGKAIVKDCIVWNNSGTQIDSYYSGDSTLVISGSDVQGGAKRNTIGNYTDAGGNFATTPTFLDDPPLISPIEGVGYDINLAVPWQN